MQQHTIDHLPVVDVAGRVIDLVERRGIDDQILLSTPTWARQSATTSKKHFVPIGLRRLVPTSTLLKPNWLKRSALNMLWR